MKYVPGLLAGQMSGKAGSTVASRGRFGSYFRTRNMPTNPNTTAQQQKRDWIANLSKAWASQSSANKLAFDSYALTFSRTDSLGSSYFMSGFDAFCSIGMNLSTFTGALTIPSSTPIGSAPDAPVTLALTADSGGTLSLAYTVTPLPALTKLVVEATGPISPGRKYIRNSDYRQIFISAAAAASPANILAAWEARFGSIAGFPGFQIAIRTFTLTNEGLRSGYATESAIIA